MTFAHESVLLRESVTAIAPADGQTIVDCTLGAGGHSEALLAAAECRVIGIDRDPAALDSASARLQPYGDRFVPVRASFSELPSVLDELGVSHVDGVLADLGVSSPQLDHAERGFSFRQSGPVDMRMDPDAELSAEQIVNKWRQEEIERVIRDYGEERHWRRAAAAIVEGRPWSDTKLLADAIAAVTKSKGRIHGATRAFQGLRIAVNDELGELERLLEVAVDRLNGGGRIAIISFHSLEDRIVKRFFSAHSGRNAERDPYGNPIGTFRLDRPAKAITPSPDDPNPRARSARLRTAVRLPWTPNRSQ